MPRVTEQLQQQIDDHADARRLAASPVDQVIDHRCEVKAAIDDARRDLIDSAMATEVKARRYVELVSDAQSEGISVRETVTLKDAIRDLANVLAPIFHGEFR